MLTNSDLVDFDFKKFLNISENSLEAFSLNCMVYDESFVKNIILKDFAHINEDELFTFCKQNRIASIVGFWLTKYASNIEFEELWLAEIDKVVFKNSKFIEEVECIAKKMQVKDIEVVALKNSGIMFGLVSELALNPMGDIDLLIAPQRLLHADSTMLELGYTRSNRLPDSHGTELINIDFEKEAASGGLEYYKDSNKDVRIWIEIQTRPVSGKWILPHQEPKPQIVIDNADSIKGRHLKILDSVDNLLQVCLHTAKHSFCRAPGIRLHTDVDRIVRQTQVDWERFIRLTIKMNIKTPCFLSLFLAKELLGTPIPKWVLESIMPNNKLRLRWLLYELKRVGIFNPDKRKWRRIEYAFFNVFLYDRPRDLIRNIWKPLNQLKSIYPNVNMWNQPIYQLKRIVELLKSQSGT